MLKVVSNDPIYTVELPLQKICLLEVYAEESNVEEDNFDENEPLRRSTGDASAIVSLKIK